MESIKERVEFFEKVLRKDLVENRCEEIGYGGNFIVGSNFVKMEGIIIGAVVPVSYTHLTLPTNSRV